MFSFGSSGPQKATKDHFNCLQKLFTMRLVINVKFWCSNLKLFILGLATWSQSKIGKTFGFPSRLQRLFRLSSHWSKQRVCIVNLVIYIFRVDLQNDRSTEPLVNSKWISGIPSISYTKGPVILEMLNSIIGDKQMRRLLREYLKVHQFGYATTASFLNVLQTVTVDQIEYETNETSQVTPVEFVSSFRKCYFKLFV